MDHTVIISGNQSKFLNAPEKYVKRAKDKCGIHLELQTTRRQFLTAQDILSRMTQGNKSQRGVLLADDVGLGKTAVAALVAWVFAGTGHQVRIFAPNNVVKRRWLDELDRHARIIGHNSSSLRVLPKYICDGHVSALQKGKIQVATHNLAINNPGMATDLLIIDEAHRAKGEHTNFKRSLVSLKKKAKRILLLTATPFSIRLKEFLNMLRLIDGGDASKDVDRFSKLLKRLYDSPRIGDPELFAAKLSESAKLATAALSKYVIRHSIDNLPKEQKSFGESTLWPLRDAEAGPHEIELLMRMDRLIRIGPMVTNKSVKNASDPRYHVGWSQFDKIVNEISERKSPKPAPVAAKIINHHLTRISQLRKEQSHHPKMVATAEAVRQVLEQDEKVVIFCHHHATAEELTMVLGASLTESKELLGLPRQIWKKAWSQVLTHQIERQVDNHKQDQVDQASVHAKDKELLPHFVDWLCSPLVRAQVSRWLVDIPFTNPTKLVKAIVKTKSRKFGEPIAVAAFRLFQALLHSKSSKMILQLAKKTSHSTRFGESRLPCQTRRILGICERQIHPDKEADGIFLGSKQPDTAFSMFNSPFGPEVLIITDSHSEGIDLHSCCRHLIHFELDPSPIRTIQRNGRVRRVNSWAARCKKPIQIAYPAFKGTRDAKLVGIMQQRITSFSLLLGGVQDFEADDVTESDESQRTEAIKLAKQKLKKYANQLLPKRH